MWFKQVINGIKNGALSSLSSALITQPFQVWTTNMMVSYKEGKPLTIVQTFKKVLKNDGVKGFYRGFAPAMIKTTYGSAVYFSVLENLKITLKNKQFTNNQNIINFMASAWSRSVQMVSVAPISVMKTRFEVSGFNSYNNWLDAIRKIRKEEGYFGFFRGLSFTLVKEVPYSALFYSTYEYTKNKLNKLGIVNTQFNSSSAGWITVALLTILTNPIEVIKTRLQYQHFSNNPSHKYKGLISGIIIISKTEGIRGLTAGMLPVFCKKGVSTVWVWTWYDTWKKKNKKV